MIKSYSMIFKNETAHSVSYEKKNSAIESPSYLKGFDLWGNLSFGLIFEKRFIKIFP